MSADVPRINVTVFASASSTTHERYIEASGAFGRALAGAQCRCINGGGNAGCMGALNVAAKAAGCTVRGVIHSMWIGEEDAKGLDERAAAVPVRVDIECDAATHETLDLQGTSHTRLQDRYAQGDCPLRRQAKQEPDAT